MPTSLVSAIWAMFDCIESAFSCREGLPDKLKKRAVGKPILEPSTQQTSQAQKTAKPKLASTRKATDRSIQQLESLHDRSSAASNIMLSPGHRLKLDSRTELMKKKKKPIPDFTIDLTELKDPQAATVTQYYLKDIDDDDELPEAPDMKSVHSIAGILRTPPSETSYSNSDIDSLIRAVPLDELVKVSTPIRKITASRKRSHVTPPRRTTLPGRPSPRHVVFASPPKKRCRYEDTKIDKFVHFQESPEEDMRMDGEDDDEQLFLPSSSDEPRYAWPEPNHSQGGPSLLENDDYYSDLDYLGSATPELTLSTSLVSGLKDDDKGDDNAYVPWNSKTLPTISKVDVAEERCSAKNALESAKDTGSITKDELMHSEDDFAELDAWLNSAAVEIL
ncbi:hypothetical protein H0H81_005659 [Sphagnurus paluster]|uniref:Uncharacterized protein n=1 Tax=Sphagnurus paluster TaxID=117069 RepID=A0A9P7FTS6_9AGAR|nr:hypothetical protein H0H81_005659 [Sphagnurus paluster]